MTIIKHKCFFLERKIIIDYNHRVYCILNEAIQSILTYDLIKAMKRKWMAIKIIRFRLEESKKCTSKYM